MRQIGKHVRANAVGYLALFVAMSGSAYAALSLPPHSVGTTQLKNKAVTLAKISPKARAALRGSTGRQGPAGAMGLKGDPGTPGVNGAPVVLRARGTSSVQTVAEPGFVVYPLTPSSWQQLGHESDVLVGTITFNAPAACPGGGLFVTVKFGGGGTNIVEPWGAAITGGVLKIPISYAFERDSASTQTATVEIDASDTCGSSHFTITGASIDIAALV